ncbi:hypothetical protein ACFLYD_00480 [Chloroflexota bacterium]
MAAPYQRARHLSGIAGSGACLLVERGQERDLGVLELEEGVALEGVDVNWQRSCGTVPSGLAAGCWGRPERWRSWSDEPLGL